MHTGDADKSRIDNCRKNDLCLLCATPDLAQESFQVESGEHLPIWLPVVTGLTVPLSSIQFHVLASLAKPPRYPQAATLQLRLLI